MGRGSRCAAIAAAGFVCALAVLALIPVAAAFASPKPLWLRATRGDHARITDYHGRELMLRGMNVNQLGDYYKLNSHPPASPLHASDFREMRRLGFNTVRLLVHWSLLEPRPGALSEAYVKKIAQAVRWASRYGIYTMIDMHQDAWGKYIAAPPGQICPPGSTPNRGWDGAPEWATITDAMLRCYSQAREISAAVAQAFQNFWDDRAGPGGVGIQARLLTTWRRLARRFRSNSAVMGFELINEPNPGFTVTGAEAQTIVPFYRRAIAAIRSVDRRHLIFVEPNIIRDLNSDPIVMPFVSDDPGLVYAPHIYADRNGRSTEGTGKATEREWSNAEREAVEAGGDGGALPVLIGEFGALDPPARDAYNSEFMALSEKHLIGWTHWVWKETCGNPHFGYGPVPPESMNVYDCRRDRFTGLKRNRVFHYSRPYPLFAPGRLIKLSFDERTKRFELAGTGGSRFALDVFVPLGVHYGRSLRRISIASRGLRRLRVTRQRDGTARLRALAPKGSYSLTLKRLPAIR
jgi:endoglycosylceramidase